jgi:hypothetical protein
MGVMVPSSPRPESSHAIKRSDLLAFTLFLLGVGMTLLLGPEWGWPFLLAGVGTGIIYAAMWRVKNPAWLSKGLIGIVVLFLVASIVVLAWKLRPIPPVEAHTAAPKIPTVEELNVMYAHAKQEYDRSHPVAKIVANSPSSPSKAASQSGTAVGTVTVQTGGVASFGQQGGVTAGTIGALVINPPTGPPQLSDAQRGSLRAWADEHNSLRMNIIAPATASAATAKFGRELEGVFSKLGARYESPLINGGCYSADLSPWI